MYEFFSLALFTVLVFGCVVMSAVIVLSTYIAIMDSDSVRRFRLWRRERLVNKFMEDLKK
jgi:hypothetical protein